MAFNFPGGGLFGGGEDLGSLLAGTSLGRGVGGKGGNRSVREPGRIDFEQQRGQQQDFFNRDQGLRQDQEQFSQGNENALNAQRTQLLQLLASLGGGFGGGLGGLFGGGVGGGGGGLGSNFLPGRTRTAGLGGLGGLLGGLGGGGLGSSFLPGQLPSSALAGLGSSFLPFI